MSPSRTENPVAMTPKTPDARSPSSNTLPTGARRRTSSSVPAARPETRTTISVDQTKLIGAGDASRIERSSRRPVGMMRAARARGRLVSVQAVLFFGLSSFLLGLMLFAVVFGATLVGVAGRLQRELWALGGRALDAAPRDSAPRLYVETLNEMIDMQTVRVAALLNNRVPPAVLVLKIAGAAIALRLLGVYPAVVGRGVLT